MENRILKSSTIIPAPLYVERSADRQLKAVIDEMGRPGYILVARQMGKTNLLLHMKRIRAFDLVIYLDLTNRFDTAQSWFRNVIDSILQTYEQDFPNASQKIRQQRAELSLEPNVEYDRHLRLLLRETEKRMVIILDEIDSLVNTPYSDTILAQVRSMYFSRANHPEYERLTYVLSGVIEPTDLIKDKNISPFNIGEKIYLESFDSEETDKFLRNANLDANPNVSAAVYGWAQGNPRMTWDICAELETQLRAGVSLDESLVDHIVNKLYLEAFDRPPIDHIRTLVKSDIQVRDAIVSIRYEKADFLDQRLKNRLYLAGITNSPGGENISIANKIIDLALPSQWLDQLETSAHDPLAAARKYFSEENYSTAVEAFEKAIASYSTETSVLVSDRILLARAYLQTLQFANSMRELEKAKENSPQPSELQLIHYYLGAAHYAQGQNNEALRYLTIAADGPSTKVRHDAQLGLAPTMLRISKTKYGREAYSLMTQLVAELDAKLPANEEDLQMMVAVLNMAAKASRAVQKKISASEYLSRALALSPKNMIPALLLLEYELEDDEDHRKLLALQISRTIIDNKLEIESQREFIPSFCKRQLGTTLLYLNETGQNAEFEKLISYYANTIHASKISIFTALKDLYAEFNEHERQYEYCSLLVMGVNNYFDGAIDPLENIEVFREIAHVYRGNNEERQKFRERYLCELEASASFSEKFFGFAHAQALAELASETLNKSVDLNYENHIFSVWNKFKIPPIPGAEFITIYVEFLMMRHFNRRREISNAKISASEVITLIDNLDEESKAGIEAQAIAVFKREAEQFLKRRPQSTIPKREQENDPFSNIKRNDKVFVQYQNGQPVLKKFKNVEADLRNKTCTLLTHVPS